MLNFSRFVDGYEIKVTEKEESVEIRVRRKLTGRIDSYSCGTSYIDEIRPVVLTSPLGGRHLWGCRRDDRIPAGGLDAGERSGLNP